jgi:hypothetical protein
METPLATVLPAGWTDPSLFSQIIISRPVLLLLVEVLLLNHMSYESSQAPLPMIDVLILVVTVPGVLISFEVDTGKPLFVVQ